MKITLSTRIRAIFAKDAEDFWFQFFTDEELILRQMDTWQLAKVISESHVNNLVGSEEKRIVAEHLLNIRLSKIQAKATWWSAIILFFGAIIGASIPFFLAVNLPSRQPQININCPYQHRDGQETPPKPINTAIKKEIRPTKAEPGSVGFKVIAPQKTDIQQKSDTKEQNNKKTPDDRNMK